jgi:hypothetical protein
VNDIIPILYHPRPQTVFWGRTAGEENRRADRLQGRALFLPALRPETKLYAKPTGTAQPEAKAVFSPHNWLGKKFTKFINLSTSFKRTSSPFYRKLSSIQHISTWACCL